MADIEKKFPSELSSRGTVLTTDILLIHNITSGATEKVTVQKLMDVNIGTKYWSCSGTNFETVNPLTDNVTKVITGTLIANDNTISLVCQINLPHGATISSAIVYGNAAAGAESWSLRRQKISDATESLMGTNTINSAHNTITNPVVDNNLYSYYIRTTSIDINDEIWGARITYTS